MSTPDPKRHPAPAAESDAAGVLDASRWPAAPAARTLDKSERLNRSLARRVAELSTLFEVLPVAVLIAESPDSLRLNPAGCRLFGLATSPGTAGRRVTTEEVEFATGTSFGSSALGRTLETGEPAHAELETTGPEGTRFLRVESTPLLGPSGQTTGGLAIFSDVTAEKASERGALEAVRATDDFLSMLGHELRNPLVAITNYLAIHEARATGDPVVDEARGLMDRQVGHLRRLVDDLLDTSRATRGALTVERRTLDLAGVVRDAVAARQGDPESSGSAIGLHIETSPCWVHGDATRLGQAVANLVHNAQKFTDRAGRIDVTLRAVEPGGVELSVRDDGIGIAPEALESIFQPFRQGRRERGGLGIGLALVRSIVELHDGRVTATSPGRGATMVVQLPRATPPRLGPGATPRDPETTSALDLLLVEDDDRTAKSMGLLLHHLGHAVTRARDATEALAMLETTTPDAVLCDLELGSGPDGRALARAIRQRSALAGLRLVALTGHGAESERAASHAAGFDAHLTKPASAEALQAALLD